MLLMDVDNILLDKNLGKLHQFSTIYEIGVTKSSAKSSDIWSALTFLKLERMRIFNTFLAKELYRERNTFKQELPQLWP